MNNKMFVFSPSSKSIVFNRNIVRLAAFVVAAAICVLGAARAQTRDKSVNAANPIKKTAANAAGNREKPSSAQTGKTNFAPNFIVAGSGVFMRENPSISGAVVEKLKFGTTLRGLERRQEPETIGGKTDFWQRVATAENKQGWVFGGLLKPFAAAGRESIYRQIARDKIKIETRTFDENAELYDFLTVAQGATKTPNVLAEISLWRLIALRAALAEIPFDKLDSAPYKDFVNANKINIVYSDPAGAWFVRSERFWSLAKKYQTSPIGEEIAWEAARNPLPGECEGYLNCYLYKMRISDAEYLKLYPRGAHAAETLKQLGEYLKGFADDAGKNEIYNPPTDVSDRAEFYKTIAELRSIVSLAASSEKEFVLQQLKIIGEKLK